MDEAMDHPLLKVYDPLDFYINLSVFNTDFIY